MAGGQCGPRPGTGAADQTDSVRQRRAAPTRLWLRVRTPPESARHRCREPTTRGTVKKYQVHLDSGESVYIDADGFSLTSDTVQFYNRVEQANPDTGRKFAICPVVATFFNGHIVWYGEVSEAEYEAYRKKAEAK